MRDDGVWKQLETILVGLDTGLLNDIDTSRVEGFLAEHWDQLVKNVDGGMQGFKVVDRTEKMEWQPPVLSFKIERHGRTVLGSSRAELQHWQLDATDCVAMFNGDSYRQKRPKNPRLDIESIAREIAPLILERSEDDRLQWISSDKVKILSASILGGQSVPKETLEGRRRRLRKALLRLIEPQGWVADGHYYGCVGSHLTRPE